MRFAIHTCWLLLLCSPAEGREKVAVLDLVARDFDATEALLLSQYVRDEFHKRVDVVPHADLYTALAKKGIEASACDDENCMAAIGRATEAKWVMAGSVGLRSNRLHLEARLYRVDQQHLFSSAQKGAETLEELRRREVKKLVAALWPSEEGSSIPWWLLVLGGGGAAYWNWGRDNSRGDENGTNDHSDGNPLGTAAIIATFDD